MGMEPAKSARSVMFTVEMYSRLGTIATAAVAGNANTKLIATPTAGRQGVRITNTDTARYLYVLEQNFSAGGPVPAAITSANVDFIIAPRETIIVHASADVLHYAAYEDGTATTGVVNAREVF